MGLTIHYTLSVKETLSAGVVRELARRTAQYARKIGCAEVSEPVRAEQDRNVAPLFFEIEQASGAGRFCTAALPRRGWLVNVLPERGGEVETAGEDCPGVAGW